MSFVSAVDARTRINREELKQFRELSETADDFKVPPVCEQCLAEEPSEEDCNLSDEDKVKLFCDPEGKIPNPFAVSIDDPLVQSFYFWYVIIFGLFGIYQIVRMYREDINGI